MYSECVRCVAKAWLGWCHQETYDGPTGEVNLGKRPNLVY